MSPIEGRSVALAAISLVALAVVAGCGGGSQADTATSSSTSVGKFTLQTIIASASMTSTMFTTNSPVRRMLATASNRPTPSPKTAVRNNTGMSPRKLVPMLP